MRLDLFLVENNYFKTRAKAQREIQNQAIKVNGRLITKASFPVEEGDTIEIIKETLAFVSQGGLKLEAAINTFALDFNDKVVLDIGASTGGFTDCSLKYGAKHIYAVDVGTSQLDSSLRNNSKVTSYENTNILDLPLFPEKIDIMVMDVSFVSVKVILPALLHYFSQANILVLLIKPQFEVGHIKMKNGVLKDKKKHLEVLENINAIFNENSLYINKIIKSPVKGGSGNQEYVALISKNKSQKINFLSII